nr:putative gustatory receptor 28a [Onthophagus taurus]
MAYKKVFPITKNLTFHSAFYVLYILTRAIGLMPLTVQKVNGKLKLNSQKSDTVYFLVYLTACFLCSSITLYSVYHNEIDYYIVQSEIVFLKYSCFIILIYTALCCSYVFRQLSSKAFGILMNVDETLSEMNAIIETKKINTIIYVMFIWMFISIAVRTSLSVFVIKMDIILKISLLPTTYVKSLTKYSFVTILMTVLIRFEAINSILKHLLTNEFENNRKISEYLEKLCKIHYKLCNVARLYNTIFSFILFASLASTLCDLIFQLYYLYVALEKKFESTNVMMFLYSTSWLVDDVIEVYILVCTCCLISDNVSILLFILIWFVTLRLRKLKNNNYYKIFIYRNLIVDAFKILINVDNSLKDMNTYIEPNKVSKIINAIILWMFTSLFIRWIFSMKAIKFDVVIKLGWFPSAYIKSLSKYTFIALIIPIMARFSKVNQLLKESFLIRNEEFISKRIKTLCLIHFKLCNANLTPIIMHQLRNKIDSPLVARQILTYSLQMLHQKVRFSAAGFFPIDYTLMYSIGGAVFGYMVIFIQFDQKQAQIICSNDTLT